MKPESTPKIEPHTHSNFPQNIHNPTRFDLRQISGRNQDKGTKSTGEIKEKSTMNSATSATQFHNSVVVPSNRLVEKTNSVTDH